MAVMNYYVQLRFKVYNFFLSDSLSLVQHNFIPRCGAFKMYALCSSASSLSTLYFLVKFILCVLWYQLVRIRNL